MTAPECRACPMPDQVAALELVRLREGIGRLAGEWEQRAETASKKPRHARPAWIPAMWNRAAELRALLDDNEGER